MYQQRTVHNLFVRMPLVMSRENITRMLSVRTMFEQSRLRMVHSQTIHIHHYMSQERMERMMLLESLIELNQVYTYHMLPVQVVIELIQVYICHMLFVLSYFVLFRGHMHCMRLLDQTKLLGRLDRRYMSHHQGCHGMNLPNSQHMPRHQTTTELFRQHITRTKLDQVQRWQNQGNTEYMMIDHSMGQLNQERKAHTGGGRCHWRSVQVHSPNMMTDLVIDWPYQWHRLHMRTNLWYRRMNQGDIGSMTESR
jgi:hypothetical protein